METKPENIFLEIFKNLPSKDQARLLDILRQYPDYFDYLISNYRNKRDALRAMDAAKMKRLVEDEKNKLVGIIEKNTEGVS